MLTEGAQIESGLAKGDSILPIDLSAVSRQRRPPEIAQKPLSKNSKLSYLKVLTKALLRQIERLENSNDDEREPLDLKSQVQRFEAELIRSALVVTGGRQRRAARLLGTKVTTMNTKIRRYQIHIEPELKSETGPYS